MPFAAHQLSSQVRRGFRLCRPAPIVINKSLTLRHLGSFSIKEYTLDGDEAEWGGSNVAELWLGARFQLLPASPAPRSLPETCQHAF